MNVPINRWYGALARFATSYFPRFLPHEKRKCEGLLCLLLEMYLYSSEADVPL